MFSAREIAIEIIRLNIPLPAELPTLPIAIIVEITVRPSDTKPTIALIFAH